jgi:hypothetical protein
MGILMNIRLRYAVIDNSLHSLLHYGAMPRQQLGHHEMTDILIGPIRQVACDARNQGYVENASVSPR